MTVSFQIPKALLFVLHIFALCLMIGLNSCDNPCRDVNCKNEGTCIQGTCTCVEPYVGDRCQTNNLTNFIGPYEAFETCDVTAAEIYNITVSLDATNPLGLVFFELHLMAINGPQFGNVKATVTGDQISIPSQTFNDFIYLEWTVSGSGTRTGDRIELDIQSSIDGGQAENCHIIMDQIF